MKTIRKEESRWRGICENAERDKNDGRIKLTSLLLTACISVDESRPVKTLEHTRRLFNEWLKEMFRESKEHTDLSEDKWILQFKACYVHRSTAGDLLHDESSAHLLVIQFLSWYESRSKSERTRGLRSQKEGTKGQYVKRKTRGADRNEDGQYSDGF